MADNVFHAEIVQRIVNKELMFAGMHKEVRILFVLHVLVAESVLLFVQEEF